MKLDLAAPEPVVRNAVFLIRLRSHLLGLESARVRKRVAELTLESRRSVAHTQSLCRRTRWLVATGQPLPRIVGRAGRRG